MAELPPELDVEAERERLRRFATEQINAAGDYLKELHELPRDAQARGAWAITDVVIVTHIWSQSDPSRAYWVISGPEFPTDHVEHSVAATPREAVRRFALSWQLQSERTKSFDKGDGRMDWEGAAAELQKRAEQLYEMTEQDDLWPERPEGSGATEH